MIITFEDLLKCATIPRQYFSSCVMNAPLLACFIAFLDFMINARSTLESFECLCH